MEEMGRVIRAVRQGFYLAVLHEITSGANLDFLA